MDITLAGILCMILVLVLLLKYIYFRKIDKIHQKLINIHNDSTLITLLETMANENPDLEALHTKKSDDEWDIITFSEYYRKVRHFAKSLNYLLGNKINVGIIGTNSTGLFYAHMGTIFNGGYSVCINTSSTPKMCEHIINDSNVSVIVVEDNEQLQKLNNINIPNVKLIIYYSPIDKTVTDNFKIKVINIATFMSKKKKLSYISDKSDIATIIYTSGSTGSPKGIELTHENILSSVNNLIKLFNMSNLNLYHGSKIISYLPLNHIASQMIDIYVPIVMGFSVWFADKNALKSTLNITMKEVKPDIFIGVPRIFEKMKEEIEKKLPFFLKSPFVSINKIISNISQISKKIKKELGLDNCKYIASTAGCILCEDFFESLNIKLYNIYGMSETCGPMAGSIPGIYKQGSVGKVIIDDVRISSNNEIMVKGKNVFSKYLNNDKETLKTFKNGYFLTGDLGKLDKDGFLYLTGRKKELLKTSNGELINPVPIEQKIHDKLKQYFEYVMLIGDKRKFLSIMLIPKNKYQNNLPDNIDELIENAIEEINSKDDINNMQIKKWMILNSTFNVNEELTQTLKLRRQFVTDKYKTQIDEIYTNIN